MLQLQDINKTYADGTRALKNINLDMGTGMVGLLGPNGAGKSTLMRTLATLQSADSGNIILQGQCIRSNPHLLRRQLGYVPQHFGVYSNISCRALLDHLAILKGMNDKVQRHQQIENLLRLTNLSHAAHRQVCHFSGGMLQRFGIAQALLGAPKVLVLDEPTSGLDPAERLRLHQILYDIAKTRLVLLSTHIVEDIEHLCANTYILLNGEIVASGPTIELFQALQGKIWMGEVNQQPMPDNAHILSQRLQYAQQVCRVYSDQQPAAGFSPVSATLEDRYFLHLNGIAMGNA